MIAHVLPEFIPPQLCAPTSPDLNPVDKTACEKYCKRLCTKKHITDLELSASPTTTCSSWPTPFSVAVSVRSDQWYVFCAPSHAILPHAV